MGPTQTRLKPTEPSLNAPALNILQQLFGPGAGNLQQKLGTQVGFGMPTNLVNAFQNYLGQPTDATRTNAAQLAMQGGLGGASTIPGFDVLTAAGPVFQRNMQEALARQHEVGPRFASAAQQQSRLLEQQGLQDFNVFSQQVLEQGRQRQLQGILGYAQANLGQQQLQGQLLLPLLQALFGQGFSGGIAVGPSPFSQFAQAAAAIGSTAIGLKGLGGARAGATGGGGGPVPQMQ